MPIIYDMPASEYHASPALGSTSIKTLADPEISLQEARYLLDHSEHKRVYEIGELAHALILEGSLDHLVARVHADSWRSKAAKEARDEAYNAGLIPVNDAEAESILGPVEAMRDAVMAHPIAGPLFKGHKAEVSLFWNQDGVPLKGRLDAWHENRGLVVDLKTVRSARPNDFRKQVSDLGYYIQARSYLSGIQMLTGEVADWLFVAVGKEAPHVVSVHRLTDFVLDDAQIRIDHAISRYKRGVEHGWTGYEEIFELDLTPWEAMKNEELDDVEIEVKAA